MEAAKKMPVWNRSGYQQFVNLWPEIMCDFDTTSVHL